MKPKYLNVIGNEAYIRNHRLSDLAKKYGTPLYVYDQKELEENMNLFKTNFQSTNFNTHIVYASKAFLVPEMCKILTEEGLWMDAVSLGDLFVAKVSKFNLEHIIFHGNNKTREELEFAITNNVVIVVDHYQELVLINQIATRLQLTVRTMFRVNPGINAHTHKYIQTATYVSKFGESIYDEKMINQIMNYYLEHQNLILLGFHSHIGSQIQEIEPFLMNIEKMMEFSEKIICEYHYPLSSVNFGGGFGIKYINEDIPINLELVLRQMIDKINLLSTKTNFYPKDVYIEPGRSILGNAGITLYTCCDFKHTYGDKNYQFIDGGMTDNIRPALYNADYCCDIVNKMNNEKNIICDIAGKCCESGDIIIYNARIPKPNYGDVIAIYATGAYSYAMASNYNNMLRPAVVFIKENAKVVARREQLEDLLRLFK